MSDKKVDIVAQILKAKAKENPQASYTALEAVQLLDRVVVDSMVTKPTVRLALSDSDYTSNSARKRIGMTMQALGVNPEALATALEDADATRHRG